MIQTFHQPFMMPSAPLNSKKMVMMLGGNDFDLNQQGRPGYYKSATNLFQKKKKVFTLDLSLQRTHSPQCGVYMKATPQSGLLSHRRTSPDEATASNASKLPKAGRCPQDIMAVPVRPRSAYEMRPAGKSNINSLEQITPIPPHLMHWVRLTKVPMKEGKMRLLFQMYSNGFSPFLFQFLFPQSREINIHFIKAFS